MHDMARKLQRGNKENGASLAIGASKDSLYTIQDGGAPSHRIAASSGQVGGWRVGAAVGLWFWAGGWVCRFVSHVRLLPALWCAVHSSN